MKIIEIKYQKKVENMKINIEKKEEKVLIEEIKLKKEENIELNICVNIEN